jgi:hypothetical protein
MTDTTQTPLTGDDDKHAKMRDFVMTWDEISDELIWDAYDDERDQLERSLAAAQAALRELSDATLAAAKCLNATAKGEGCELTDWVRAKQKMHDARLKANKLLTPQEGERNG